MKLMPIEQNMLLSLNQYHDNGFVCTFANNLDSLEDYNDDFQVLLRLLNLKYWKIKALISCNKNNRHYKREESLFLVSPSDNKNLSFENIVCEMTDDSILVQPIDDGAYLLHLDYLEKSQKRQFLDCKQFDAIKSFVRLKYFEEVAGYKSVELQDIEVKLFFESPSSPLEAQCFHINKQCWLT